jgi:recombination protein RecA
MMHADGISYEGDLLDLGMERKIIARTGTWFRYGEQQLGQGKEKAREYLKENAALADEIKQKVLAAGGEAPAASGGSAAPADDGDAADADDF